MPKKIIHKLPKNASTDDLKQLIPGYETMLKKVLLTILDRFERDEDYPFIDTKLDISTGEDFPSSDNMRGKEIIYTWIQGRGLEAMSGHLEWVKDSNLFNVQKKEAISTRIVELLNKVSSAMERMRHANGGRLFFCMSRDGNPLKVIDFSHPVPETETLSDKPANYSDLFYSKGLFKAAVILDNQKLMQNAQDYFEHAVNDIEQNRFRTDQQALDPQNKVCHVSGKQSQGPMMIALSGLAEVGNITGDLKWFDYAETFIRRIINLHVVTASYNGFELFDFIEAVDKQEQPWLDNGKVICDPGHALEFVGLASKCLINMRQHQKYRKLIDECSTILPRVLTHIFNLGFNTKAGGICKAYDLISRKPVNADMPWWSLPETIRACCNILSLYPDCPQSEEIVGTIAKCSNAFASKYINYNVHMMAYQTLNESGEIAVAIPATPDADPGYHTGLSLIDSIKQLQTLKQ